jgi:hypothetical protein
MFLWQRIFHISLCLAIVQLSTVSSRASVVTYTDFASWQPAAANLNTIFAVTIPEPGSSPPNCVMDFYCFFGTGDASVTYSGVQFSQSGTPCPDCNFFNVGTAFSSEAPALSSQAPPPPPTEIANILITLPESARAFALDYDTFNGSEVTFTLSNGAVINQPSTADGYATTDFFGVTDTTPFTSVLLAVPEDILNINNISYVNNVSSIPEPITWPVLSASLIALACFRRRRKTG